MKIMLINPTLYGECMTQHLGLTAIASYLADRTSHQVCLIDFGFRRKGWRKYLHQRIAAEQPDVFGIAISTPNQYAVRLILAELRPYARLVIAGGHHVTLCPQHVLEELGLDVGVIGDGEVTLAEVLDCLEQGRSLEHVAGIWWRRGEETVCNPQRPVVHCLGDLPSSRWEHWEDLHLHFRSYGFLSFNGMRGCPYDCSYCSARALREVLPGNFRMVDPQRYVQEIRRQFDLYQSKGMKVAWLWDQVFTVNLTWLREFAAAYIRAGLHRELPYSVYARGDELDEERVRLLHDSGCIVVRIGFENGDERLRYEVYEKRISTAAFMQAAELCRKYGISVTGYFIVGGPGDTRESMQKTFELARRLQTDTPTFYVYKPLPRTRASELVSQYGGTIQDHWSRQVLDIRFGAMIDYPHLKATQVGRFHWKCILYFVPRMVWRQVVHFKLGYVSRLVSYAFDLRGRGIPLLDLCRNFTYVCTVDMARERWKKRDLPEAGVLLTPDGGKGCGQNPKRGGAHAAVPVAQPADWDVPAGRPLPGAGEHGGP